MHTKEQETTSEITAESMHAALEVSPHVVLNDPASFHIAVGKAQMEGLAFVEVSESLFRFLANGKPTDYIMWGTPTVRVYRAGTRELIEKNETLLPDELLKVSGANS